MSFTDMQGMEELNEQSYAVTVKGPYSFEIRASTRRPWARTPREATAQVKVPTTVAFKSLRDALTSPGEFLVSDFAKFDRPGVLHQAFRGLHAWKTSNGGKPPIPGDADAADGVLASAKKLNADAGEGEFKLEDAEMGGEANEKVIRSLSLTAAGVVNPMCAFLGGVAGQEVLKACSGKFMPIRQWFYFDAAEVLPDEPPSAERVRPSGAATTRRSSFPGRTCRRSSRRSSTSSSAPAPSAARCSRTGRSSAWARARRARCT